MTHATRNTTTGLQFEEQVQVKNVGIDLTKYKLYKYLEKNDINWKNLISKKLLPDEAYFNPETKEFSIYEKSFNRLLVLLMRNLRLAPLKFINLEKLVKLLVQKKLLILTF